MKRFKHLVLICVLLSVSFPIESTAALNSENYSVDNEMVAVDAVTALGNSASYSVGGNAGEIYIYNPATEPASTATYGTLVGYRDRQLNLKDTEEETLIDSDLLVLCHDHDGERYAVYTTTKVFLALLEAYKDVDYGGHETHSFDIIPSFNYYFKGENGFYPGHNWTPANQELHANGCEKYLEFSVQSAAPEVEAPSRNPTQIPLTPPPPEAIPVCNDTSAPKRTTSAINDQTLLIVDIPADAFRVGGDAQELYYLRTEPVNQNLYATRYARFSQELATLEQSQSEEVPTYIPPNLQFSTKLPSEVSYEQACEDYERSDSEIFESINLSSNLAPPTSWEVLLTQEQPAELALITTPFKLSVTDAQGQQVEVFRKPVSLTVSNLAIRNNPESVYVTIPSADSETWFEVPFSVVDDEIRFSLSAPAEIYIWYAFTPKSDDAVLDSPVSEKSSVLLTLEDFIPALLALLILLILTILLVLSRRSQKM